jgi:polysaccharide export outer membrane protein
MRRLAALLGLAIALSPHCALGQDQDLYEIGPKDVLSLAVIGQPQMTGDFTVNREGILVLPVLGSVKVADMTPPELERKLTTLLADGYLKEPHVSVSVKEYRSRRVFVTGEVSQPGTYPLRGDRTLRALLADIGRVGGGAGYEVVVMRPPQAPAASVEAPPSAFQGSEIPTDQDPSVPIVPDQVPGARTFRLNMNALRAGDTSANMLLEDGDTVYVPPARQVFISGQVARQGPYRYQEGMTVLQALTLAGGVTQRGSQGRVKIIRAVDGKRTEVKAKLGDIIEPQDTIVVPERLF